MWGNKNRNSVISTNVTELVHRQTGKAGERGYVTYVLQGCPGIALEKKGSHKYQPMIFFSSLNKQKFKAG
jgi:hypothetical protein